MNRFARLAALLFIAIGTFGQGISIPGASTQNPNQVTVSTAYLYYNKMHWAGVWSGSATYNSQDVVSYSGSTYVSIQVANLNNNPASASLWWTAIVGGGGGGGGSTVTACVATGGSANAQACPGSPVPATYTQLTGYFVPNATSTAALTLNIATLGVEPVYINGAASSATNVVTSGLVYPWYYDGAHFQLASGAGGTNNVYCASSGTTTLTCTPSPVINAYTPGMLVYLFPGSSGAGGATTLNLSSLGALTVKQSDCATNPASTDFVAGVMSVLIYNGTLLCEYPSGGGGTTTSYSTHTLNAGDCGNYQAVTGNQTGPATIPSTTCVYTIVNISAGTITFAPSGVTIYDSSATGGSTASRNIASGTFARFTSLGGAAWVGSGTYTASAGTGLAKAGFYLTDGTNYFIPQTLTQATLFSASGFAFNGGSGWSAAASGNAEILTMSGTNRGGYEANLTSHTSLTVAVYASSFGNTGNSTAEVFIGVRNGSNGAICGVNSGGSNVNMYYGEIPSDATYTYSGNYQGPFSMAGSIGGVIWIRLTVISGTTTCWGSADGVNFTAYVSGSGFSGSPTYWAVGGQSLNSAFGGGYIDILSWALI